MFRLPTLTLPRLAWGLNSRPRHHQHHGLPSVRRRLPRVGTRRSARPQVLQLVTAALLNATPAMIGTQAASISFGCGALCLTGMARRDLSNRQVLTHRPCRPIGRSIASQRSIAQGRSAKRASRPLSRLSRVETAARRLPRRRITNGGDHEDSHAFPSRGRSHARLRELCSAGAGRPPVAPRAQLLTRRIWRIRPLARARVSTALPTRPRPPFTAQVIARLPRALRPADFAGGMAVMGHAPGRGHGHAGPAHRAPHGGSIGIYLPRFGLRIGFIGLSLACPVVGSNEFCRCCVNRSTGANGISGDAPAPCRHPANRMYCRMVAFFRIGRRIGKSRGRELPILTR